MSDSRKHHDHLVAQATDRGRLIELGWLALRAELLPFDTPVDQVKQARMCYLAGAQHLWASLLSFLEDGSEPTMQDLQRMAKVSAELEAFAAWLKAERTSRSRRAAP